VIDIPVLDARGIHTYYGVSHILHGVDFTVRRGETVGLMGRNGMGKTTLLRSVLGLVRPHRGEVHRRRRNDGDAYAIARALRMSLKGAASSPICRCARTWWARAGADGRCEWSFERVMQTFPRLAERLGHGGAQLSGGEQQMLTIGRALMTNPDLLILDEATEGLAPKISREIWGIIGRIKQAGIAAVIVDKNFAAVSAVADRVLILVKGATVYEGSSAELRAQPELRVKYLGV
jgi:branched-chain amino acid transport system ATP-binding protein